MPDYTDVPISSFPDAQSVDASDKVTGLKSGNNTNFSFNSILAWLISQFYAVFLPASSKGAARGVASLDSNGKVPGTQLDLSGKQDTITASGILKGDGQGGVSAAVAGTDYQAPLTIDATPTANSTNPVQSGGVYTDVRTRVPNYGKGINLFDNSWFTVNQRGVVSGTAVNAEYFLSRWVIRRASYSISGHTVTVTATANEYGIYQPMKLGTLVTGEKYTISADIDGEIKSLTFTMPSATGYVGYLSTNVRIYIQISASSVNVWFTIPTANASFTISRAKIELGEETTLEGDIEPNYEEELIKCQTSTADPSDTYANKTLATEQQLAYVESGTTASRTYAVGEYFCWNGLLHRAKTAISSGQSFTPGTNCEQVPEGIGNSLQAISTTSITPTSVNPLPSGVTGMVFVTRIGKLRFVNLYNIILASFSPGATICTLGQGDRPNPSYRGDYGFQVSARSTGNWVQATQKVCFVRFLGSGDIVLYGDYTAGWYITGTLIIIAEG